MTDDLSIVDLNVRSQVHLAKLLLQDMVARHRGRLLITSSVAAISPGPFQSVYNASKSFLQSFAQALHEELKHTGVTVTSLMPGATDTPLFERADLLDTRLGQSEKDDPALVARQGYEAMMDGRDKVIAGSFKVEVQARASAVLPDRMKATAHRKMTEPGSGHRR